MCTQTALHSLTYSNPSELPFCGCPCGDCFINIAQLSESVSCSVKEASGFRPRFVLECSISMQLGH